MSLARQLTPPAGFLPVLLDGLNFPAINPDAHGPQSAASNPLHPYFLLCIVRVSNHDFRPVHQLRCYRLQHAMKFSPCIVVGHPEFLWI